MHPAYFYTLKFHKCMKIHNLIITQELVNTIVTEVTWFISSGSAVKTVFFVGMYRAGDLIGWRGKKVEETLALRRWRRRRRWLSSRRPMEHGASRRYHGHRGAGRSSPSGVHATRDARLWSSSWLCGFREGFSRLPRGETVVLALTCARISLDTRTKRTTPVFLSSEAQDFWF